MSGRELRIALGMRGGVSLAVWIGGACAEIDAVRRATSDDGGLWSRLRAAAGYDTVVVDVMAGASAGGLNGVLFAASQAHDFPMDALRQLWVDVADTSKLVRTAPPWLSLFEGDDYFFDEIERALQRLVGDDATDSTDRPRLDLRLSATLVEPITRHVPSPSDERLLERRYSSGFRFRSPPYRWLTTDFPPAGRQRLGNLSRLALAARATSSYPGAFEAASVRSSRADSFGAGPSELSSGRDVDMCGILLDRRGTEASDDDHRFLLADGGILDNIPLGLAMEAVDDAPAAGPTDRFLVYLHPGSPSTPASARVADALTRRSSIKVLEATAASRISGEDIRADIAQLDDHNDAIERAATVRRATFAPLGDAAALVAEAVRWRGSYGVARANEDARLIGELLDDPIHHLREDAFPARVGTGSPREVSDARWRAPLLEPPLVGVSTLRSDLTERFARRLDEWQSGRAAPESVFTIGVRPLLRVTQILLEWCIAVEAIDGIDASVASAEKALLYRINTFVRVGVDRPRQLAWVAIAATAPPSTTARQVVTRALATLDVVVGGADTDVAAVVRALVRDDRAGHDELQRAVRASLERIDRAVDAAWSVDEHVDSSTVAPDDVRTAIVRDVLVPVVRRLQPLAVRWTAESPSPAWYLNRVLSTASGDDDDLVALLASLEVMCFAEFAAGHPGRRPTKFVRLSAANATPLAPHFEALLDEARRTGRWWDPATTGAADQQGLHVELKLAGNELANFSAFLRSEWRANDWLWGCLDAVPTLVEMLTPVPALQAFAGAPSLLEELITGGATPRWQEFLRREVWDRWEPSISAELDAIPDTPEDAEIAASAIRKALIARRQFEILGRLLSGDTSSPPDLDAIRTYRVGAQTIRDADLRRPMRRQLRVLTDTFASVAVENVQRTGTPALGKVGRINLWGRLARWTLRRVGRSIGKRLTR